MGLASTKRQMSARELSLQTIESADELDRLAPEWDELVRADSRPNPFLLHGWISAWLEHYGGAFEIRIASARRAAICEVTSEAVSKVATRAPSRSTGLNASV